VTYGERSGFTAGRRAGGPGDQALAINHWYVGKLPAETDLSTGIVAGVVALGEADLSTGRDRAGLAVSFRDAVAAPVARAEQVHIAVPPYRGKSFLAVLAWLAVEHLAQPGAEVTWYMTKNQGPDSVRAMLEMRGWRLSKDRDGRFIRLRGEAPPRADRPQPREFMTTLGKCENVRLAADYGVFSPDHVDDGTALLLNVALEQEPVLRVADIGVGYGALAIGLVLNGVAGSAVGSDVDAVALWLAEENARANAVPLDLAMTGDPAAVEPTSLTVCNIPTHISADASFRFMASLAERSRRGTLLVVVHAALEDRYARHLAPAGMLRRFPGPAHVVIRASR
jgi:16S rRNA G1207 methylase RsmC